VGVFVAVGWAVDVGVANELGVACGVAARADAAAAAATAVGGVPVKVAMNVGAGDGIAGVAGGFFPPQAASESATINSRM
jgi:hypothetical protein